MNKEEKLKIDYEQTSIYFHNLADIRFKLLTLVPIATIAAIALLQRTPSGERIIAIGILGFLVSLGITIYDQRNTQLYDAMQRRAKALEAELGFLSFDKNRKLGGAFLDRPRRSKKLFKMLLMWHDRGLAIVYGTVLAGWVHLITEGFIKVFVSNPNTLFMLIRIVIPAFTFILFLWQLHKFDEPTDVPSALSEHSRRLVFHNDN